MVQELSISTQNLDKLLSKKEQEEIKYLNKTSNKARKRLKKNGDLLNISINEFLTRWANINIIIISEIVQLLSNLNRYSHYFDDIDETGQWFTGISRFIADFIKILTKDSRPIFIGFTLILLSFGLHIIQISS